MVITTSAVMFFKLRHSFFFFFFFFNDTATTEIYTLSLHDALPILVVGLGCEVFQIERLKSKYGLIEGDNFRTDRKSTRLNSSHLVISYAVFCLKKKNKQHINHNE